MIRRAHLLLGGIIGVGIASFDHLDAEALQLLKVVGSMSDNFTENSQHGEILDNGLLELCLFFRWIRVIESDEELSIVVIGEELVENGSLRCHFGQ